MTREEAGQVLDLLASVPGVAVRCTDPQAANVIIATLAKERGMSVTCIASLSPMEVYVVNKKHQALAGVYSSRGLPAAEADLLRLQGNGEYREDAHPRVSHQDERAGPGPADSGDR